MGNMRKVVHFFAVLLVLIVITVAVYPLISVNAQEVSLLETKAAEETVCAAAPNGETTRTDAAVPKTVPTEPALEKQKTPAATVEKKQFPVEVAVEDKTPVETIAEDEILVKAAEEDKITAETTAEIEEIPVETIPSLEALRENMESDGYQSIPLYFQTDYPNNLYGGGSIADNGCSVTCLAMVATYLTGHEYLPDELARYFGGVAENNIERLEKGAQAMQLPWEELPNFHIAMDALREGKIIIALMNSSSLFTENQHFIVLTGFNENGLIMVNDPYEPNYQKWNMKRAFQEGFTEGDICAGFSGAWAFDKSAMPEEPFLYYEEDLRGDPRYPNIQLTYEEKLLLARVVWVEARGETAEGQQAVAEVVLNRIASDNFPDTLNAVIYADGQFRSVPYLAEATPEQAQFDAIEHAVYGPNVLPEGVVHFATYPTNGRIWGQIGGHIFCY